MKINCLNVVLASVHGLMAGGALADVVTWTGAANDGNRWSTPANWNPTVPTANDTAVFDVAEATTVVVDAETAVARQVKIAAQSAAVSFGGDGLLTISMSGGVGANEQAQATMPILNLNCTSVETTFACRLHLSATGKVAFGPGCTYSNDVTTASVYVMFGGIKDVTPGADFAKSVFRAGFSSSGANLQVIVGLSASHELVIDNGASPDRAFSTEKLYFSINNGTTETHGRMTVRSGRVEVGTEVGHAATGTSMLVVEGGVFRAKSVNANLRGHVRVTDGGLFDYTKNMMAGGTAQHVDCLWDDDAVLVGAGYRLRPLDNAAVFIDETDPALFYLDGILDLDGDNAILTLDPAYKKGSVLDGRRRGEIRAKDIRVQGSPVVLRNLSLCVGTQFSTVHDGGTFCFENDTIRMYGDLSDYVAKSKAFRFSGSNTIDMADCKGADLSHAAVFTNSSFEDPTGALTVTGGGAVSFETVSFLGASLTVEKKTTARFLKCSGFEADVLTLDDGAQFAVDGSAMDVDSFVLGDGVTISMTLDKNDGRGLSANRVTQKGAVTWNVTLADGLDAAAYPVVSGAALDPARTTVNLTDVTGKSFTVKFTEAGVFVVPSDVTPTEAYEWTGAVDGRWSVAANWTALPPAGAHLFASGFGSLAMNNDFPDGTFLGSMTFRPTAGPFAVTGNAIVFTNGVSSSLEPVTVQNASRARVTFANDVTFAHATAVVDGGTGGVAFNGRLRTTDGGYADHLYVKGTVGIGGEAVVHKLMLVGDATLRVLHGGRLTVTNQPNFSAQSLRSGSIVVEAGGIFDWAASNGRPLVWTLSSKPHVVDGTMIVSRYGLDTGMSQTFTGSGRLDIASFSYCRGQALSVRDGLRLNVGGDFATANTNGEPMCATIALADATLGACADWTYGPSAAATDRASLGTTSVQRALMLTGSCTVDTQNPDTGAAQTIVFADPVDGSSATLEKKGLGRLVLTRDDNDLTGGLTLTAGTVVLGAPNVGFVAESVTFAGGGLSIPKAARRAYGNWTTLLKARSVVGELTCPDGYLELRTVRQDDFVEIQGRGTAKGLMYIIR